MLQLHASSSRDDLARETTLAVLAGGEGRRMGCPKGELQLHGRPILHYLHEQIAWPGPTLLVTAPGRENPPAYELFTSQACDPVAGEGPLRGISTALTAAQTDLTLIVTVDMPGPRLSHLAWLLNRFAEESKMLGAMLIRRTPRGDQIEPFPAAFRQSALATIHAQLAAGQRSVRTLCDLPGFGAFLALGWPDSIWTNLNKPADLNAFQAGDCSKELSCE